VLLLNTKERRGELEIEQDEENHANATEMDAFTREDLHESDVGVIHCPRTEKKKI